MKFTYESVEYKEGDTIEFDDIYKGGAAPEKVYGKIKFGEYDDAEGYDVAKHLGFYVSYHIWDYYMTLPDTINRYNGRKIEVY